MQIILLSDSIAREEMNRQGTVSDAGIQWIQDPSEFSKYASADAWIDLMFECTSERIDLLCGLKKGIVIISSVEHTLTEIQRPFVRINGWRTFLSASVLEGAAGPAQQEKAEEVLSLFHKSIKWVPDEPGFVVARVVSMIVNEAYITLHEKVSSVEDINTAMKLGTSYPFGPFEWADLIGQDKIAALLKKMSGKNNRYHPDWYQPKFNIKT